MLPRCRRSGQKASALDPVFFTHGTRYSRKKPRHGGDESPPSRSLVYESRGRRIISLLPSLPSLPPRALGFVFCALIPSDQRPPRASRAPPITASDLALPDTRSQSSPLLRQILQPVAVSSIGPSPSSEGVPLEEGGGRGDADGPGGVVGDEGREMAKVVVSIVDGMSLQEDEAAALRLAIACGDANISGAIELFRCSTVGVLL